MEPGAEALGGGAEVEDLGAGGLGLLEESDRTGGGGGAAAEGEDLVLGFERGFESQGFGLSEGLLAALGEGFGNGACAEDFRCCVVEVLEWERERGATARPIVWFAGAAEADEDQEHGQRVPPRPAAGVWGWTPMALS